MRLLALLFAALPAWAALSVTGASSVAPTTVRAGASVTVAGGTSRWLHVAGPAVAVFAAPASASTAAVFPSPGAYVVNNGAESLTVYATAGNAAGVVTWSDPNIAKIFPTLPRQGASAWPYLDTLHTQMATKLFITESGDPNFSGVNESTAQAGTISVTNASATITGTGTSFQTLICGGPGNTTPIGGGGINAVIIVWYNAPGGGTGRRHYYPSACVSQTQLTLQSPYLATAGTTAGLSWSYSTCEGCWLGGGANTNYYDNVLGLYALYYRTGDTAWRDRARTLAAKWYRWPLDEGRMTYGDGGSRYPAPRLQALIGVMWWAYETGNSDVFAKLYDYIFVPTLHPNLVATVASPYNMIRDVREQGYELGFVAVAYLLDPDATRRAAHRAAVDAAIPQWLSKVGTNGAPAGIVVNPGAGSQIDDGFSVTNGSATVTRAAGGVNGFAGRAGVSPIWFFTSSYQQGGDAVSYEFTVVNDTTLTLASPYTGTTGASKGAMSGTLIGPGVQPILLSLATRMMYLASLAASPTQAAQAQGMVVSFADWLTTNAFSAETGGLVYSNVHPGCGDDLETRAGNICVYGPPDAPGAYGVTTAARYLISEGVSGITGAEILSPSSTRRTAWDGAMGRCYGYTGGGPGTDWAASPSDTANRNWCRGFTEGVGTGGAQAHKSFGFAFGIGGGANYAGARLGAYAADLRGIAVAAGSGVSVDVRFTDGTVVAATCISGACTAVYDAAQGSPQIRIIRGGVPGPWQ